MSGGDDKIPESGKQISNDFWVNGIVAARNNQPYIQLSTSNGLLMQLSIADARKIANDIVTMCSRTEADALILRFFGKIMEIPEGAIVAMMQEFRNFRHELDMDQVEGKDEDPGDPPQWTPPT
jgi:hypothetical protein